MIYLINHFKKILCTHPIISTEKTFALFCCIFPNFHAQFLHLCFFLCQTMKIIFKIRCSFHVKITVQTFFRFPTTITGISSCKIDVSTAAQMKRLSTSSSLNIFIKYYPASGHVQSPSPGRNFVAIYERRKVVFTDCI